MKVGLIGAGGIAPPHVQGFIRSRAVEAVVVADPDREARQWLADRFGIVKATCSRHQDLLADDSIELVDVCVPHDLHHPIVLDALRAGKHVICEKPLALNVPQADEMIAAAEQHQRRLFCSLNQRMYPAHIEAKKLIESGDLGEPFLGAVIVLGDELTRMDDPKSWKGDRKRAGGGALFDTGHHAVYMLQHFLGNATAVTCSARRLRVTAKGKADDTSVLSLEIGEARSGSITVTYAATGTPWSESRVIVGSKGSLHIMDPAGDEEVEPLVGYYEKEFVRLPVHNPPGLQSYSIRRTIGHFLDCLLNDKESDITLAEARAAVATMSAAYEAARTGQRVEVR